MARLFAVNDTTMPIPDTHMEMVANAQSHGVIGGCGVTLDAADLTLDIAAGAIVSNGAPVVVAAQANALTLVADSTNPRWSWVALNSSGTAVLVSGTAAASPAIPELNATDDVPLMLVYVAAGGTVASSQTNYDQRIPIMTQTWVCTATLTKNANTTLADVVGLAFFMDVSQTWVFEVHLQISTGATPDIKLAFTVPASAAATGTWLYHATTAMASARVADWTSAQSLATAAAGTGATLAGRAVNSTTAGWVQLQMAQDTSNASDTIVYIGSHLVARRVA
ncbi:MAG TPA: hypothetical protein VFH61_18595 [Thermoleophilia bacterium]|nr:hypothetical protein [Thermoleophilia bacterium]